MISYWNRNMVARNYLKNSYQCIRLLVHKYFQQLAELRLSDTLTYKPMNCKL